jgi:hypothetical protein
MDLLARAIPAVAVILCVVGCGVNRKLKLTEVQPNAIEVYLDEPSSHRLDLTNLKLTWAAKDAATPPTRGEINLGVGGTLDGGRFLIIWEDTNYIGAPVRQNFQPSVAGIKVPSGSFPPYGNTPGVSVRVAGKHYRSLFLVRDQVSDVVRFGPMPRPDRFGAFTEDGSLAAEKPSGNRSISRDFSAGAPVDTDSESDWSVRFASPGAPTQ